MADGERDSFIEQDDVVLGNSDSGTTSLFPLRTHRAAKKTSHHRKKAKNSRRHKSSRHASHKAKYGTAAWMKHIRGMRGKHKHKHHKHRKRRK